MPRNNRFDEAAATRSFQNKNRNLQTEGRKSLKAFDHNNSAFIASEQQALQQSINNPVLADSLDGDLDKIKNHFPKLRHHVGSSQNFASYN